MHKLVLTVMMAEDALPGELRATVEVVSYDRPGGCPFTDATGELVRVEGSGAGIRAELVADKHGEFGPRVNRLTVPTDLEFLKAAAKLLGGVLFVGKKVI